MILITYKNKSSNSWKLYLTQSAVSEKLNVVGQTELFHLHCRTLVNHRVLNLQRATLRT